MVFPGVLPPALWTCCLLEPGSAGEVVEENGVSWPAAWAHKMAVGGLPQGALDLERELELLSELGSFMLLGLDF